MFTSWLGFLFSLVANLSKELVVYMSSLGGNNCVARILPFGGGYEHLRIIRSSW